MRKRFFFKIKTITIPARVLPDGINPSVICCFHKLLAAPSPHIIQDSDGGAGGHLSCRVSAEPSPDQPSARDTRTLSVQSRTVRAGSPTGDIISSGSSRRLCSHTFTVSKKQDNKFIFSSMFIKMFICPRISHTHSYSNPRSSLAINTWSPFKPEITNLVGTYSVSMDCILRTSAHICNLQFTAAVLVSIALPFRLRQNIRTIIYWRRRSKPLPAWAKGHNIWPFFIPHCFTLFLAVYYSFHLEIIKIMQSLSSPLW